jgi:hypothetical protein
MNNKRSLLIALAVIVILAGTAFAYYKTSHETFQAPAQLSDAEVGDIVSAVGRHILLPADEKPLIATVADIDLLLEKEPFYKGAKNGDILLLYPNAGKAILYNQEGDIIVNVGPIVLDQTADNGTTATDTSADESEEPLEGTPTE